MRRRSGRTRRAAIGRTTARAVHCTRDDRPAATGRAHLRAGYGNALHFPSGHFQRVPAARWLGRDTAGGRHPVLGTTALPAPGYEHGLPEPVIRFWHEP
jgi:hypothetical protein